MAFPLAQALSVGAGFGQAALQKDSEGPDAPVKQTAESKIEKGDVIIHSPSPIPLVIAGVVVGGLVVWAFLNG